MEERSMAWIAVDDYTHPEGWRDPSRSAERARCYCEQLERGKVLFFPAPPFDLPDADRQFLVAQRQSTSRLHKNISYRPGQDVLRGSLSDHPKDAALLHDAMRRYSEQVTGFLTRFLSPYAPHWALDYASYRPLEEQGRDLPLHKRNDLLHVDAFPTRPTGGGRILRVFTNVNPTEPRVWLTGPDFRSLARSTAADAGLARIAAATSSPPPMARGLATIKRAVGLRVVERSPYDQFMLRYHDYLKEDASFQEQSEKTRLEFPPSSTWIVFTDAVPHAALSGRCALEQTYIIPVEAMVAPSEAPIRILEELCGRSLSVR
jgi:3-deoxy-D-manno-octulosonic acid hydroxylase-like protein